MIVFFQILTPMSNHLMNFIDKVMRNDSSSYLDRSTRDVIGHSDEFSSIESSPSFNSLDAALSAVAFLSFVIWLINILLPNLNDINELNSRKYHQEVLQNILEDQPHLWNQLDNREDQKVITKTLLSDPNSSLNPLSATSKLIPSLKHKPNQRLKQNRLNPLKLRNRTELKPRSIWDRALDLSRNLTSSIHFYLHQFYTQIVNFFT